MLWRLWILFYFPPKECWFFKICFRRQLTWLEPNCKRYQLGSSPVLSSSLLASSGLLRVCCVQRCFKSQPDLGGIYLQIWGSPFLTLPVRAIVHNSSSGSSGTGFLLGFQPLPSTLQVVGFLIFYPEFIFVICGKISSTGTYLAITRAKFYISLKKGF